MWRVISSHCRPNDLLMTRFASATQVIMKLDLHDEAHLINSRSPLAAVFDDMRHVIPANAPVEVPQPTVKDLS